MPDNGISSSLPPPAGAATPRERGDARDPQAPGQPREATATQAAGNETPAARDANRPATVNPPEVVVELRQDQTPENDVEAGREPQARAASDTTDLFQPPVTNQPRGPVQQVETGGEEGREDFRNQAVAENTGTPQGVQGTPPPSETAATPPPTPPVETELRNAENPVSAQGSVERAVETPPAETPGPVRDNLQTQAVRTDRIEAPEPPPTPAATPEPPAPRAGSVADLPDTPEPAATPATAGPDAETETTGGTQPPEPPANENAFNTIERLTRPSAEEVLGTQVNINA